MSGLRTRHQITVINIYAVDCGESTARCIDLGNSPYENRYILGEVMYIVLTGDIRGSSKVDDRRELADRLVDLCAHLNRYFASNIVVKFKVVSGDGIQGLLALDTNIFKLAYYVRAVIFPYYMRLGFGVGGIDTAIDEDISKMDGECFSFSSRAVDEVKRQNIGIQFNSKFHYLNSLLNSLCVLQDAVLSKLTELQNDVFRYYVKMSIETRKVTQSKIAVSLETTQPNINRIFNTTEFKALINHYETIFNLNEVMKESS